jgi:hypothetical protein
MRVECFTLLAMSSTPFAMVVLVGLLAVVVTPGAGLDR